MFSPAHFTWFYILMALLLFSCGRQLNEKEIESDVVEKNEATDLGISSGTDCWDERMNHWFFAFHRYQEQGMNMFEADQQAVAESDAAYQNCLNLVSKRRFSDKRTVRK